MPKAKFQVYSLHSRDGGGGGVPILSFANRCQFHQHFMSSFCAKIILPKNTYPIFKCIKAAQTTSVQKAACKILVKLTPGWPWGGGESLLTWMSSRSTGCPNADSASIGGNEASCKFPSPDGSKSGRKGTSKWSAPPLLFSAESFLCPDLYLDGSLSTTYPTCAQVLQNF